MLNPQEPFTIAFNILIYSVRLLAPGSAIIRRLPDAFDTRQWLSCNADIPIISPVTAAGPPRNFTAFRSLNNNASNIKNKYCY